MDFLIVPADRPDWSVSREDFQAYVAGRWPSAEFFNASDESPMVMTAQLEFSNGNLQVDLDRDGTMLSITAPDVTTAAEFGAWWAGQAPDLTPGVRMYVTADFNRSVALRREISAGEIAEALST